MLPDTSFAEKEFDPKLARMSVQGQAQSILPFDAIPTGVWPMDGGLIWVNLGQFAEEVPPWTIYPGARDYFLRNLAKYEPMMASALYSMKTRMVTLGYEMQGDEEAKQRAKDILNSADYGKGMASLVAKGTDDLLSTDNGLFIERIGPGRPDSPLPPARIMGIAHMDSRRCYRTFNPEFPVVYENPETGKWHKMHHTRIVTTSDNPQPIERARGIGFCAVSRALQWVRIIRDTLTYREEKIAGRFTRGMGLVKGVQEKTLKDALKQNDENADAKGFIIYKGIPLIVAPSYEGKSDADIILKDFASLPDGFNFENDLTLYAYILAFCFGVDAREFWPATAAGATKADATVQNQKARGRGIGALIRTWEWVIRQCISPVVEFEYDFTDDEQDLLRYQVQKERVLTLSQLKLDGAITPLEERALAIADGIIDPKVLEEAKKLEPIEPATPEAPDEDAVEPADDLDTAEPVDEATPEGEKTLHKRPFDEGEKASVRQPANAYYERLANDFQRQLEAAVEAAIDNLPDEPTAVEISNESEALRADLYALLQLGLTNAFGAGLAGAQPTALGQFNLQMLASSQQAYLNNLIGDFSQAITSNFNAGLSGSDLRGSLSSFVSRAALYAGAFWEALWRGLGDMLTQQPEKLKVRRMLDDRAAHCKTCPPKAREYDSFEQMMSEAGMPGDGSDDCRSNCRCWVEVETAPGSGVFERLNGKPTVFTSPLVRLG